MTDVLVPDERAGSGEETPQDSLVSRRWVLNRFAMVSAAATGSALLPAAPAGAAPRAGARPTVPDVVVRRAALDDLTELTIAEAVTLIRRRRLRPVQLIAAYLDRIEQFEGVYQAYADRPSRAEALAAASRVSSRSGLLTGVGLAPKDNFYTEDLLTEAGSLVFAGFQPDYDATAVRRLTEQGGVVLGKGQMGNLAGGRATVPGTLIPTTRNAWTPDDVRYSPSGSSSGPATAVAARLATAGIGTQTGGSITGPGQAQGLTALKPTFGRVSLYGVIPLTFVRDHAGPMARDALDAAVMLQALAGPDPADPRTLGLPAPANYIRAATPVGGRSPRLRFRSTIGVWPGYLTPSSSEVRTRRSDLVAELEQMGTRFVELTPPEDYEVLSGVLNGSTGDPTAPFIEHLRRDVRLFADRLPRFLNGMLQSADSYLKVQQGRYLLLQRFLEQVFDRCDVVLGAPSGVFDGTGMPLLTFPIGMVTEATTGLRVPTGALIGARPFGEERLLDVAAAYQAVTGWHLQRPPDPTTSAPTTSAPTTAGAGAASTTPARASLRIGARSAVRPAATTVQPFGVDPAEEQ